MARCLVLIVANAALASASNVVLMRSAAAPLPPMAPQVSLSADALPPIAIAFNPGGTLQVVDKERATVPANIPKVSLVMDKAQEKSHLNSTVQSTANSTQTQSTSTLKAGMKGGLAGMLAGLLQVACLMWIRTIMNHQYYHGGGFVETMQSLYIEGGIPRFYQGVTFAAMQVPLARFGDTFSQSAVAASLVSFGLAKHGLATGVIVATICALWRLCIAPLDTLKLTAQVHGTSAGKLFGRRLQEGGLSELWSGALAMFALIWVGSIPFWTTYNAVMQYWPDSHYEPMHVFRNGVAGVLASLACDIVSNWLRVLKVKRQAAEVGSVSIEGYFRDARDVIRKDGLYGLVFRGMFTKLAAGAIQGAFFSVFWNMLLGH